MSRPIRRGTHLAAFALAVTGLIIAGAGMTAYITQDHASYGLATAGAGAGLALGGVVALTF